MARAAKKKMAPKKKAAAMKGPSRRTVGDKLGKTRQDIVAYVKKYTDSKGGGPRIRDIAQALSKVAKQTIYRHVQLLERDGVLYRHEDGLTVGIASGEAARRRELMERFARLSSAEMEKALKGK